MIEHLRGLTPDASRGATTIARCHDRLAARRRKAEARTRPSAKALTAERLLVAGFCFVYLLAMAGDLLALAALR